MQSNLSWFNRGVITQNMRSVGWIGIIYLVALLFSMPLQLVMMDGNDRYPYRFIESDSLFMIGGGFQVVLMFVIPILLGVFLLRYMHVKASADFIHSLPIKRTALYNNHVIFGVVTLLLPVIITALVTVIVHGTLALDEYFSVVDIAEWAGIMIVLNLFVFMLSMLIGTITGLSPVQAILSFIFLIFPAGILILFLYNLKYFIFGFAYDYYFSQNLEYLIPIFRVVESAYSKFTGKELFIYTLLAFIFYLLGMFAYKKRHIEGATQAISFRYLKPVFKYGVTFCSMLLGGMYFGEVQGEELGWLVFGYFFGSIVGYLVAEMLLQKTWRVFKSLKWYVVYGVIVVAVGFLLNLDITGYEKQVPVVNNIERAYFGDHLHYFREANQPSQSSVYDAIDQEDRYFFTDVENIGSIVMLHKKLIEDRNSMSMNDRFYKNVAIGYEMKDGSKWVRQYRIPEDAYASLYKVIYESDEYRYSYNDLLRLEEDVTVDKIRMSSYDIVQKSFETTDAKQVAEMINALKYDMLHEPYEEMFDHREPWGDIELLLENDQRLHITWKKSYDQFEKWLEGEGLLSQTRLVADDIDYILVAENDRRPEERYRGYSMEERLEYIESNDNAVKIEDKDEIEQYLRQSSWGPDTDYIMAIYSKGAAAPEVRGIVKE